MPLELDPAFYAYARRRETPTEGMKRIERNLRSDDFEYRDRPDTNPGSITTGAGRSMHGYNAGIGAQGPLSAGLIAAGDQTTGQPVMVGGRAQAGPLSYQYTQPTFKGAPAGQQIGVTVPFDADAYFGVTAQQGPGGRTYGANVSGDGWNAYGQYNPQRRDLNVGAGYQANFAGGGPVHMYKGGDAPPRPLTIYRGERPMVDAEPETSLYPSQDERPIPVPVPRPDRRPSITPGALAARIVPPEEQSPIGGQQAASPSPESFTEGLTAAAEGVAPLGKIVGEYAASRAQDPSQIPGDVAAFGKTMYHAATEDPIGFIGGMLPGVGNVMAAGDVAKLKDAAAKAEAEGNFELADKLKALVTTAMAGVAAPMSGGVVAKGAVRAGERAVLEGAERAAVQAISSADTSIKQIPALFKSKNFEAETGARNLDIGGGKYDLGTDYLKAERGVDSSVYDPFNRSPEHNAAILDEFKQNPADSVTAANVLNVIAEPEARADVIKQAFDHLKPGGKAYFDIYEGNKSGEGAATSKGWQNNMKAKDFLEEVKSVFPDVERKGSMLIATKPLDEVSVEGLQRGVVEGAEKTAAPALYRPVREAYQDMPEPVAIRTQAVDHITESIAASDGAAAQLPTKLGLGPMYIVDSGAESVSKKSGFMLNSTKNANAARQLDGITPLMNEFPDMGTNPEQWAQGMSKAFGSKDVVAPPYRFMKAIESGEYTDLLRTLTPGQIADADAGFAAGKDFLKAYHSGQMGVEDTGKLFMWGIMSRGVNPFTHEGLFLDAFNGIEPFIKMAAEGKLTEKIANGPYKEWAATTAGKGSGQPGAGAMHNLNAFGKDFLVKMGKPGADGITPMQKLHDMMSDPEMTGRDIRREFAKVGEGVGIDNKVVSFILLATGRDDVMVIDRIQLKNLWDDGRYADMNIWDGISVPTVKMKDGTTKRFPPTDEGRAAAKAFAKENPGSKGGNAAVTGSSLAEATYGAKGILVYEALEDALMKNVGKMYADLGRPEAASPGRFHWETWVARSNQEASHGTLPAILKKVQGSNNPLEGVYSKQGDYQSYAYGAKYGRSAEGQPQFTIPLSTGEEIVMSPQQYSAALDIIRKPSAGVIPSGKGQKFNVTDTVGMPWYEREGVNRARLDEVLRQAAAGQAGPVRKAGGGPVSDGSGAGAGGGGTGQIGGPAASLISDVHRMATEQGLSTRDLSLLIKAATGAPAQWAHGLAGHLLSGDDTFLREHAAKYPKIAEVIGKIGAMLSGDKVPESANIDHKLVAEAARANRNPNVKKALGALMQRN